jgi:hypothetical protein
MNLFVSTFVLSGELGMQSGKGNAGVVLTMMMDFRAG